MNVKDLWAYREAVAAIHTARENLKEYESIIYSARGPNPGRTPSGSRRSPDIFGIIADRHDKLLVAEENARLKAHRAFAVLLAFGKTLPDDDVDILRLRWMKGLTHREIGTELHRSERTVKRAIRRIKEKFEKFEYNCEE